MIGALIAGMFAANSPLATIYRNIHHLPVHFRFGPLIIDAPLVWWVNEGLMTIFFFVVGLEIKRQLIEGHLATPRHAMLPLVAAIGGMIVPAIVYLAVNWGNPDGFDGWAVPTATDIVLAIGILSLLGRKVPATHKVFLTALAIFDDVGAVLIVGLFYGHHFSLLPLFLVIIGVGALFLLNTLRTTRPFYYCAVGLFLWLAMHEAGANAALSGVLVAIAIPRRGRYPGSPLRRAERSLHPWSVLVIVPLFAFLNAGIIIDYELWSSLFGSVSIGVAVGLIFGKPIGVLAATWLAVRFRIGELPKGVSWRQVCGLALLSGMGFTISLYISSLAFSDPTIAASAKLGILAGSLVSGIAGLTVLKASLK
jgi:NhaA family Na+:H+ antiporter